MVLTNSWGVRVHRDNTPRPCRMQVSKGGYGHASVLDGSDTITDKQLALEAARAVWRGNTVKIGINGSVTGAATVLGIGSMVVFRAQSTNGRAQDAVEYIKAYDSDNNDVGRYNTIDKTYTALLQLIRHNHFRVIAFGDPLSFRPYSQIHPQNIQYTVRVADRLNHVPVGHLACRRKTDRDPNSVYSRY